MTTGIYGSNVFLYPCAGLDVAQPISEFGMQFDTMLFVDLGYQFGSRFHAPSIDGWSELEESVRIEGPKESSLKVFKSGKHCRKEVEPAWRKSIYQHTQSGRHVNIVFRRGYGQYALQEIADGTLGMFLHRGDSQGEGGSGVCYLSNRRMQHAPLSNLLNAIKSKLALPALIGSDGSNTSIRQLYEAAQEDDTLTEFNQHGLLWKRYRTLLRPNDCRLTVVWHVEELKSSNGDHQT
jgi:hypothetical protein